MQKESQFSIDACADILHVNSNKLYQKCKSVYVLADDLIEEKYDWLMGFVPERLEDFLKKQKVAVRRGMLFRGFKMALESAMGGAVLREAFTENLPDFLSKSIKTSRVSWACCPEVVSFMFCTPYRNNEKEHICLSEHDCFINGLCICMASKQILPVRLACEYDIFYHTRYPERAKDFDVFVDKVAELNELNPTMVTKHNDKPYPTNDCERSIE